MSLVSEVENNTRKFIDSINKIEKKKIGQFFTDGNTALFMANMFDFTNIKREIKVLDPGAGSGILSAAFIQVIQERNVEQVELVLVENNKDVLPLLRENMLKISSLSNIKINIEIVDENYIVSQSIDFSMNMNSYYKDFDYIISNPPYLKIPRNSEETVGFNSIISGAPNLYYLFLSLSLFNLKDLGEMVYIIPRSWTSGAYFTKFRQYVFSNSNISQIHLFKSRNKVFKAESVLQETVIVKFIKNKKINEVIITNSSDNTFSDLTILKSSHDYIVRGENKYVFLPISESQINILEIIDEFQYTLPKLGMKLKTGKTVDFKNKKLLRKKEQKDSIPLFYSSNFLDGRIKFPNENEEFQYIIPTSSLKQKNKNYLFLKRFSSKEEKRRLQPAIFFKNGKFGKYISTDNKINFIEKINRESIDADVIQGLYVLFNSTYYDEYYRILNGSTQVNATEVNSLPIPNIEKIKKLGKFMQEYGDYTTHSCDMIFEKELLK